jgi:hypothetical protein
MLTDEEIVELRKSFIADGYLTIGDLATEVLRLRKLVGETKSEEFNFNRWIEATEIGNKYVGECTEVLILIDQEYLRYLECLVRFVSPGQPPCISGPARIDRRVLESWGVLPKENDEQSG